MSNYLRCLAVLLSLTVNVFADPNASNPSPPNGTTDVYPDIVLTWTPG